MSTRIQTALPWGELVDFDASDSDGWCTPPEVIEPVLSYLDERGQTAIGLDPCSNAHSIVPALQAWTIADDCLMRPAFMWAEHVSIYLNAPYSNPGPFLERFADAIELGADGVTLVKHDHTTDWWEKLWRRAAAVCMLRRRVRHVIGGARRVQATFPSSIVLPRGPAVSVDRFRSAFEPHGTVIAERGRW